MGIIFKSIVSNVKETLAPDSARVVVSYNHVGRRTLTPEIVKEAMTVFILYVITYVIGALVGIAHRVRSHSRNLRVGGHDVQRRHHHVGGGPGMAGTLELFYIFQMWLAAWSS